MDQAWGPACSSAGAVGRGRLTPTRWRGPAPATASAQTRLSSSASSPDGSSSSDRGPARGGQGPDGPCAQVAGAAVRLGPPAGQGPRGLGPAGVADEAAEAGQGVVAAASDGARRHGVPFLRAGVVPAGSGRCAAAYLGGDTKRSGAAAGPPPLRGRARSGRRDLCWQARTRSGRRSAGPGEGAVLAGRRIGSTRTPCGSTGLIWPGRRGLSSEIHPDFAEFVTELDARIVRSIASIVANSPG